MNIFIVESKYKIKPIKQYLGKNWTVIATNGHICHFEDFDFDIISSLTSIEDVLPFFKPLSNNSFFRDFKRLLDNPHGGIYIGTDCDREGEFIAFSIVHFFHLSSFYRCIFNEISESSILHSIANPISINYQVVYSGISRTIIDYSIGFMISPFLNKFIGGWGGGGGGGSGGGGSGKKGCKGTSLSAGRCQTVALRLIYDRFIKKNENTKEYSVTGVFFEKYKLPFQFHSKHSFSKDSLYDFFEKSKTHQHFFTMSNKKDVFKSPPLPLNTATLLQSSFNILSYSPKKTMYIAQKLYQMGKITYIRTQSTQYSVDFIQTSLQFIQNSFGKEYIISDDNLVRIKNDISNSNIPHEAIRPTNIFNIPTEDCDPLYKLIWNNTVRSCMASAFFHIYDLSVDSPIEDGVYKHSLEIPIFLGWTKQLETVNKLKNKNKPIIVGGVTTANEILLFLLSLNKTNPIICSSINSEVVIKTPHRYFTEAGLIQTLEELEIGRPSTYSHFAEVIKERGYVNIGDISGVSVECENLTLSFSNNTTPVLRSTVETKTFGKENNKIVIQPIGIVCIDFLIQHFHELFRYDYTADMEKQLDRVAYSSSGLSWTDFVKNVYNNILQTTLSIPNISKFKISIDSFNEMCFLQNKPYIKRKINIKPKLKKSKSTLKKTESASDTSKNGSECKGGKKYEYYPLKPSLELNLEQLKNGLYPLEDLIEYPNTVLGKYKGTILKIKTGQFGHYLEWGEKDGEKREGEGGEGGEGRKEEKKDNIHTLSLNSLDTYLFPIYHFTEQQAIDFINSKIDNLVNSSQNKRILRVVDPFTSIRYGKFGTYIFHKTDDMKKPLFFSLKKHDFDFLNASEEEIYLFIGKRLS